MGFAGGLAAAAQKNQVLELRYYYLRNSHDNQVQRTSDFLGKAHLPALQRAGAIAAGCFASVIAEQSPFLVTVASYASLAAMEAAMEKLSADGEYGKAADAYHSAQGLGYVRTESSLLRAFDSIPAVEVPATDGQRAPRIFELRTYESNNPATLKRKIKMFDEGEIAIFRKTGLQPVFFGETIVGPKMPNLTYLLAFDSLAAREKNWQTFVGHPEWLKLRAQPGLSDAEIVSNISNSILRPLPFSMIR